MMKVTKVLDAIGFTLSLSEEEALQLSCLSRWTVSIPEALAGQGMSRKKVANFLYELQTALSVGGVPASEFDGPIFREEEVMPAKKPSEEER